VRVIAGQAKGRKLKAVKGITTRPTADRVKEALFNILRERIDDCYFLDLYAGTGSIGIEALSRGAKKAFFVDAEKQAVQVIKENLFLTNFIEQAEIYQQNVSKATLLLGKKNQQFDLIFLDPPYYQGLEEQTLKAIEHNNLLQEQGLVIVEHLHKNSLPSTVENLCLMRSEKYGDTSLSFYQKGG